MIQVKQDLCNGCRLCERNCAFGAIEFIEKTPIFKENCLLCGECANTCPKNAIKIEINTNITQDFSNYRGFWVFMQMDEKSGKPKKVSYELLGEARRLADRVGQEVTGICLCAEEPPDLCAEMQSIGCDKLMIVQNPKLKDYDTDIFTAIVSGFITKYKPSVVLFPATENGRDLAPRVSARLKVGLTADCTALDIDDKGRLIQIRPTYGGNIMASIITPDYRPQMASVRPNVFAVVPCRRKGEFTVEKIAIEIDEKMQRVKRIGFKKKKEVYGDVSEASIIIAGGYGIKNRENFKLLHDLALKTGAAVGASRKAVDEGWAPFDIQIGQTGKTVAPDLYIACGISGALQHAIGIKNAKKIIAINNDPAAPIFSMSHVAILADIRQVLLSLNKQVDKLGAEAFCQGGEKI